MFQSTHQLHNHRGRIIILLRLEVGQNGIQLLCPSEILVPDDASDVTKRLALETIFYDSRCRLVLAFSLCIDSYDLVLMDRLFREESLPWTDHIRRGKLRQIVRR